MPAYTAKQYIEASRTIAPVAVLDLMERDKTVQAGGKLVVLVYAFTVTSAAGTRSVDVAVPAINAKRNMGRTSAYGFTERESARDMARAEGLHLLTVAALAAYDAVAVKLAAEHPFPAADIRRVTFALEGNVERIRDVLANASAMGISLP